MTTYETIMLSVCFGAVIGAFIGNLIVIIKWAVDDRKEKKRRKALANKQEHKD